MSKLKIYSAVIIFTVLLGVIFPFTFETDRFYTHFFYLPIALTAIWFPKYSVWVGLGFGLEHFFMEYLSIGEISIHAGVRTLIILVVSLMLSRIYKWEKKFVTKIEELSYENAHDEMTQVFNRAYFDERLKENPMTPFAVLICDIDNLKEVNDQFGHPVGDQLIRTMAEILKDELPVEAFCARIGGDEFCVFFQNTQEKIVKEYIERIKKRAGSVRWNEQKYAEKIGFHFSVGYSFSVHDDDIFTMLREADQRMYTEKYEHKKEKEFK